MRVGGTGRKPDSLFRTKRGQWFTQIFVVCVNGSELQSIWSRSNMSYLRFYFIHQSEAGFIRGRSGRPIACEGISEEEGLCHS
jgi:hypothetical protein